MNFGFTEEQRKFRQEVRDFLEKEKANGSIGARGGGMLEGRSPEFSKKVAERGWIGMTWPKQYGGQGRSYVDRAIMMEEFLRYQAPISYHFLGDRQVGPALIHFANDELKNEYLPQIRAGELSFCLLFSEPDAGSDLVSAKTSAREDGDYYVINGQKVWTSGGHLAELGWLLARTDPQAPKRKGLSEFIIDMKTPGITIRPLINIAGAHSFNEVFFDEVRIPKRNLVGEKNRGFYQIMAQMDYERAGLERLMQNYPLYVDILDYVKKTSRNGLPLKNDSRIKHSLAQVEIEYNVGRLFCYYVAWVLDQGRIPNLEAAMCKAYCTQYEKRLSDLATRILGPAGQLMPESYGAPLNGLAAECYLWSPSYTIQGGSVEVLKNIVATRGLGLPTES